ncbi:MAG: hypothetical protein AAF222_15205 [Pseudomonadota bacterium]
MSKPLGSSFDPDIWREQVRLKGDRLDGRSEFRHCLWPVFDLFHGIDGVGGILGADRIALDRGVHLLHRR